jgi:hypothetical protein
MLPEWISVVVIVTNPNAEGKVSPQFIQHVLLEVGPGQLMGPRLSEHAHQDALGRSRVQPFAARLVSPRRRGQMAFIRVRRIGGRLNMK